MVPVVDITPLQTEHRHRGIGGYVHGLIDGFNDLGVAHETYGFEPSTVDEETYTPVRGIRRPRGPDIACWAQLILRGHRPLGSRDLFHLTSYTAAGVRPPTTYVATVYDFVPSRWPDFYLRSLRSRFLYHRYLERLRAASVVFAISEAVADECSTAIGHSGESVVVTPLAPRPLPEPRTDHPLVERPFVLAIGTADPNKNLAFAHEVMRCVRDTGYDLALVHTGTNGGELDGVFKESRRRGLQTVHLGHVDDQTLSDLYHHAVVSLMPSLYEGFGLPALEAMAVRGKIIVSDRGALPQTVGDAGLVLPLDPDLWTDAVVSFAEDSADWDTAMAVLHARSYSWALTAEVTAAAYEDLGARLDT